MAASSRSTFDYLDTPTKIPNWIKSLEEELDCLLLVILRDGRKLVGYLRTFDQYGNLVLEDTLEKFVLENKWYADLPLGCMIIRGENIVLFGAVDKNKEEEIGLIQKPLGEVLQILELQQQHQPQNTNTQSFTSMGNINNPSQKDEQDIQNVQNDKSSNASSIKNATKKRSNRAHNFNFSYISGMDIYDE